MIVKMTIENATSTILSDIDIVPSGLLFYHRVIVPEPYQCGDTPSEMFAEKHGIRGILIQYGQQPRRL